MNKKLCYLLKLHWICTFVVSRCIHVRTYVPCNSYREVNIQCKHRCTVHYTYVPKAATRQWNMAHSDHWKCLYTTVSCCKWHSARESPQQNLTVHFAFTYVTLYTYVRTWHAGPSWHYPSQCNLYTYSTHRYMHVHTAPTYKKSVPA